MAPNSLARETAKERPRSLKLPVGFCPSSLIHTRPTPIRDARRGESNSGVHPSPRDIWNLGYEPVTPLHTAIDLIVVLIDLIDVI